MVAKSGEKVEMEFEEGVGEMIVIEARR